MCRKIFPQTLFIILITVYLAAAQPFRAKSASQINFYLENDQEVSYINVLFLIDIYHWREAGGDRDAAVWFSEMLRKESAGAGALQLDTPGAFQAAERLNPKEVICFGVKVPAEKFPPILELLRKIEQNKIDYHTSAANFRLPSARDSLLFEKIFTNGRGGEEANFRSMSFYRKKAYFRKHKIQPFLSVSLYGHFDTLEFLQQFSLTMTDSLDGRRQKNSAFRMDTFSLAGKRYYRFMLGPPNHLQLIALQWLEDMLRPATLKQADSLSVPDVFYVLSFEGSNFLLSVDEARAAKILCRKIRKLRLHQAECIRAWYNTVYIPRLKFSYDNPSLRARSYLLSGLYLAKVDEIFRIYTGGQLPLEGIQRVTYPILNGLLKMMAEGNASF